MTEEATGGEAVEATTTEAPEGQVETQDTTTEVQDDSTSRLEQRMEEIARSVQQQAQYLQQFGQEPEEDEYTLDPGDDGYEDQEAERRLREFVQTEAEKMVTPFVRQQQVAQRDQAYEKLTEQHPDLGDPAKAQPHVEKAAAFAEQFAPGLIDRPEFVDLVAAFYKAHVADERAARERPAQQPNVHLEQGGGAAPQQAQEDSDEAIAKRILGAGAGTNDF